MPCPFCMIAGTSPPSLDPPIFSSPAGSAYYVLSTPLVVAFLDIAPLSRGHVLICPRTHGAKVSDLSPSVAAAIGFWIPVISRAVMRALWGGEQGNWNVVQANGADAGQTVPHTHFHIVPREKIEREGEMIDKERGQIALGEGPRAKLDAEEGKIVSELVKVEVKKEIQKLKGAGELVGGEGGELWMKVEGRGLKL